MRKLDSTWFLKDVAKHEMQVLRDDGVYRHIRFKKPDTGCMHFDLITWPGRLCYTGDMGTFVFSRLPDMFEFFKTEQREDGSFRIDRGYWAEKCDAEGRLGGGVAEFDPEEFIREITRQRRKLVVKHGRDMMQYERIEMWDELEDVKNSAEEGEHCAISAVQNFVFWIDKPDQWGNTRTSIRLNTDEFPRCQRYTGRFNWCCQALAWGINTYDKAKTPVAA